MHPASICCCWTHVGKWPGWLCVCKAPYAGLWQKKGRKKENYIPVPVYLSPSNWEGGDGKVTGGCLCHLRDGWMDVTPSVVIAPHSCSCVCCWGSAAAESHWLYLIRNRDHVLRKKCVAPNYLCSQWEQYGCCFTVSLCLLTKVSRWSLSWKTAMEMFANILLRRFVLLLFLPLCREKNMGGSRIPSTPSTNISKVFICSLVRLQFQVRRGWMAVTGRWPANTVLTCFLTWDVHSNACASAGSPLCSSKAVALAVLRRTPLLGCCVRCHVGLWGMQLLQRYKPEPAASPAESCLLSLQ